MRDDKVVAAPTKSQRLTGIMYAWNAMNWLAFGELRPHSKFDDDPGLDDRWLYTDSQAILLQALDARAADHSHYLIFPSWRHGRYFSHPACGPGGPAFLRDVRARARKRLGRLISYADLAGILRGELAERSAIADANADRINDARQTLLQEAKAGNLTVRGLQQYTGAWRENPGEDKWISPETFNNACVTITDFDFVGPDPKDPVACATYTGDTFVEVFFSADEIIKLKSSFKYLEHEAPESDPMAAKLRPASREAVELAIRKVYAFATREQQHPPNVKTLVGPVNMVLRRDGTTASQACIVEIAAGRSGDRGKPGVRATLPAFSSESFEKSL